MEKYLLLSNLCLLDHDCAGHPESSARLQSVLAALEESPYKQYLDLSNDRQAMRDELAQVHEAAYVDRVLSLDGENTEIDFETPLSKGSVKAALTVAGLGLELVEQVIKGNIQNGFLLGRPPGHHARPDTGMGFCIFNNIAIAAKKALSMGLSRILIIDWDVHHGNGTQDAFYEDDRVFFIDLHQDNLFPQNSGLLNERGRGKGLGFTCNIPLPDSCRDADYLYAFEKIVKPLARQYRPELILVSAGFDAHESDPLGSMNLTTHGFGLMSAKAKALAHELCGGKLLLFLEGGYNPHFLAQNVMECIRVLVNQTEDAESNSSPYSNEVKTLIDGIYEDRTQLT